ncbi:MAG: undecaprenyl-diphosphate phosphatase [Candidatus Heimdallarchaeaceae archaeon]
MILWILLLFAVLQGLLEWLPVSSEGQTVALLTSLIQINPTEAISISLWLHLGTLIAVIIRYRREIAEYLDFRKKNEELYSWRWFILLSTIGTMIIGVPCYLLLYFLGESVFFGEYITLVIGIALLIIAGMLFYSRKVDKEGKTIEEINKKKMLIAGFLQGLAIIPGISRSGITMGGLLLMGVDKNDSMKGSFLMSIPAVLGGFILNLSWSLVQHKQLLTVEWWHMLLAIVVTAIIGYATIEALLQVAKKYNFAIVCLILGLIIIVFFLIGALV